MARRQTLATFSATTFDDEATVFVCHACAKTVCLGTAAVVRLKCAFSHKNFLQNKRARLYVDIVCVKRTCIASGGF